MKKATLVTAIILGFTLNTTAVQAEASQEENVGFISGAISGAVIGGPIGFFVGGIAGVLIGEQVEKANQLDDVKAELANNSSEKAAIEEELASLKQQSYDQSFDTTSGAEWITEGLTLNLMFTTNSAELSANDHQMINRLANVLTEYPELKIRLDGYSDTRGNENMNMTLSQSRVQSVEKAFESVGISASRLIIRAHGETLATATLGDIDGYALDRRVSVNFITSEKESVAQN